MLKKRYTFKEVTEMIPVDANKLRYLTVGRTQGKWHTPALLVRKADYKLTLENNRAKYYYYPSAIDKIKKHLGV